MKTILVCGVLLLASEYLCGVAGLSCYECKLPRQEDGEERDMRCVEAPWNISNSVKTCMPHLKACKIVRVDHKESGKIQSFVRGCSAMGKDSRDEKSSTITYYRYCTTNKCNKGSGLDDSGGDTERIVAILVQDISDAALPGVVSSSVVVISSLFVAFSIPQIL